jgi:hypothetical protein
VRPVTACPSQGPAQHSISASFVRCLKSTQLTVIGYPAKQTGPRSRWPTQPKLAATRWTGMKNKYVRVGSERVKSTDPLCSRQGISCAHCTNGTAGAQEGFGVPASQQRMAGRSEWHPGNVSFRLLPTLRSRRTAQPSLRCFACVRPTTSQCRYRLAEGCTLSGHRGSASRRRKLH